MNRLRIHDATFDYLIAGSGIVGRQILKLCRFIHRKDQDKFDRATGVAGFWLRLPWLRRLLGVRFVSPLLDVFYTYYIGGSLTRSDQLTFARLHGMDGAAHRLTLFNAIFCGFPCALGYFILGEGFGLLKGIHSYAELPSLLAQHTSLGFGLTSLAVDIFRAADSYLNRRCWAPFGFVPLAINTPTYLKRLFSAGGPAVKSNMQMQTPPGSPQSGNANRTGESASGPDDESNGPRGYLSKGFANSRRAIRHSR